MAKPCLPSQTANRANGSRLGMQNARNASSVPRAAVRGQSRSAISLFEQDASRGVCVAPVSDRDGFRLCSDGCAARDGKDDTALSFVGATTAEGEDRFYLPDAMHFRRVAEASAF